MQMTAPQTALAEAAAPLCPFKFEGFQKNRAGDIVLWLYRCAYTGSTFGVGIGESIERRHREHLANWRAGAARREIKAGRLAEALPVCEVCGRSERDGRWARRQMLHRAKFIPGRCPEHEEAEHEAGN